MFYLLKKVKRHLNSLLNSHILFHANIFEKHYKKRVLLSYLPLDSSCTKNGPHNYSHTNYTECLTAAQIFDQLGYNVDTILYGAKKKIDFSEYDVIYGMADNLEKSFEIDKKIKRIFYATGCNPVWANLESLKKDRRFYALAHIHAFPSCRVAVPVDKQYILSDCVVVLGNEFTKSTYTRFEESAERFRNLGCFFYKISDIDPSKKDFNKARRNILWFGSGGALHKGLDLSIELALRHPDYVLHICGSNHEAEKEFWSYYEPIVKKSENIIDYGFIDLRSNDFHALMHHCAFAIFPSVSEGGGPALLTVMGNAGLIPLTSVRTGIDLPDYIPILPENKNELPEYERLLVYWETIPETTLKTYSINLQKTISKKYSYANYKINLTDIIKSAIGI